jgi:hypothetical protein
MRHCRNDEGGKAAGADVSDYTEEEAAVWLAKPEVALVMGDHGNPLKPSDAGTMKDMEERMRRVDEAVRIRRANPRQRGQGPPSDRVSDIVR